MLRYFTMSDCAESLQPATKVVESIDNRLAVAIGEYREQLVQERDKAWQNALMYVSLFASFVASKSQGQMFRSYLKTGELW